MRIFGVICSSVLLATLFVATKELANDDDDSDPAAYMIVLEHEGGWQCAASLVSTRTGVTTARCARGMGAHSEIFGATGELWALAAELLSARPPPPPASSARRVTRVALAGDGRDPADPSLDIAVVELEAPFGMEAFTRPILMATTRGGCEDTSECFAIRALAALVASGGTKRARFRVVNLARAPEKLCAARVPHWAASRSSLLCFTGGELCERDMGSGVVCGGKLCGVLSATANVNGAGQCSETYAAQNIALWRSFLHCAHTLRLCGRGICKDVCSEHLLSEEKDDTTNIAVTTISSTPEYARRGSLESVSQPPHTTHTPLSFTTELPTACTSLFDMSSEDPSDYSRPASNLRPALLFEPNRADFKAAPTRTSRPGLKAGEYGDNAADYGVEEAPLPARPASSPSEQLVPARTTADTPPAAPAAPALLVPSLPELTSASKVFNSISLHPVFIYSMTFYIVLN